MLAQQISMDPTLPGMVRTDGTGEGACDGILSEEEANPYSHIVSAVKVGEVGNGSRVEACLERSDHESQGDERTTTPDERVGKSEGSPAKLGKMLLCVIVAKRERACHHDCNPMFGAEPSSHRSRRRLKEYEGDEEQGDSQIEVIWSCADVPSKA